MNDAYASLIEQKFGYNWQQKVKVDWKKIPLMISHNINEQLSSRSGHTRYIEIVKSSVYTSTKENASNGALRDKMCVGLSLDNFEVHCLPLTGRKDKEKCVDIHLAMDMLYLATVPDSYDIAIIVTGNKDFMPAMEKTRLFGKRVALCSVRNSCNRDLDKPEAPIKIKDFDVVWLDDYLDDIFIPLTSTQGEKCYYFIIIHIE
jgi:uncharacterized LabA/DUF88 family protein